MKPPRASKVFPVAAHDHYEQTPRISTPRLYLRPMTEGDAELIVAWRSEPSTAAMFFSSPPTLQEHLDWFHSDREDRVDYVIAIAEERRPIGVVNFKNIDLSGGIAEGGKLLGDRSSRGKGYAKEAFAAWLLYGFGTLELETIEVRTRADNSPNIGLNKRLGFTTDDKYTARAGDGTQQTFLRMTLNRKAIQDHPYFHQIDEQAYFERLPGNITQ